MLVESPARPGLTVAVVPAMDETAFVMDEIRGRYSRTTLSLRDVADRILAAAGLILISPILLAIALAIRLDSPGPAIFTQTRIGRNRKPFTFVKFRGMFADAPERFPQLYRYQYSSDEVPNLHFHSEDDPRVTRLGRFLRRTSLDELPNLINVVFGDMSLVGPRPEIPEMLPYYGPAADIVLSVKPGVTSLAKLVGRDHLTFRETLELDVEYVRIRSLSKDLRILLATTMLVLTGKSVGC